MRACGTPGLPPLHGARATAETARAPAAPCARARRPARARQSCARHPACRPSSCPRLELDEAVATGLPVLVSRTSLPRRSGRTVRPCISVVSVVSYAIVQRSVLSVGRPDLRIIAGLDRPRPRFWPCAPPPWREVCVRDVLRLLDHNRCSWRWRLRRSSNSFTYCAIVVYGGILLLYRQLVLDRRPRGERANIELARHARRRPTYFTFACRVSGIDAPPLCPQPGPQGHRGVGSPTKGLRESTTLSVSRNPIYSSVATCRIPTTQQGIQSGHPTRKSTYLITEATWEVGSWVPAPAPAPEGVH